jgi:hypothetical protein
MSTLIGHNKQFVSVNSLSSSDKDYLKGVIKELDDSLTRVASERDLQKEAIEKAAEKLGIDKKLIRKLGKTHHKANFNTESEENKTFEEFYTIIMKGGSNNV